VRATAWLSSIRCVCPCGTYNSNKITCTLDMRVGYFPLLLGNHAGNANSLSPITSDTPKSWLKPLVRCAHSEPSQSDVTGHGKFKEIGIHGPCHTLPRITSLLRRRAGLKCLRTQDGHEPTSVFHSQGCFAWLEGIISMFSTVI
jgi:hypothetical protein